MMTSIQDYTTGFRHETPEADDVQGTGRPRVLIFWMSPIYQSDQGGLLVRSLFADWSKDDLAQIHTGHPIDGPLYCAHVFGLSPNERRFGRFFYRIKQSSFGESTRPLILEQSSALPQAQKVSRIQLVRGTLNKFLLNTGIWEIIFRTRISSQLVEFIQTFRPDVMYVPGYTLSYSWLSMTINRRFNIPIVFHPFDDWPNALYKHVPLIHRIVLRTVSRLIQRSAARISFSQRMADAYHKQFGVPFEIVMNADDFDRFSAAVPQRAADPSVISIIYSGALGLKRWQALCDLSDAAAALEAEGIRIQVTAYASSIPFEAVEAVNERHNLRILPPLAHERVPEYLKGADILFLPESFDPNLIENLRYSISTKAQLYMMSQQPVLVYGPSEAGIVDYAQRDQWAYVVSKRDQTALMNALRTLISDQALRERLIKTGVEVAARNHDQRIVRGRFMKIMQQAAKKPST